jgi:hypothetical protein
VLFQLCEVVWKARKPTRAGELSLLRGQVGWAYGEDVRLVCRLAVRMD